MKLLEFKEINLSDLFFDSLKNDYTEFEAWFKSKADSGSSAFVEIENNTIQGFLYLKVNKEKSQMSPQNFPIRNG